MAQGEKWASTRVPNLVRYQPAGTYYARVRIGGGAERWRSLRTDSEVVAKLRLPGVIAKLRAAAGSLAVTVTLGAAAEIYLDRKRAAGLKARAVEYREETVTALRRSWPLFDRITAGLVTKVDCEVWAQRTRGNYSASRFNGMMESLRGTLQVAVEAGALEKNPAEEIKRARLVRSEQPVYSSAQLQALFHELKRRKPGQRRGHAYYLVKFLCYFSGRVGTARALTPQMVDRARGEFQIPGELVKRGQPGEVLRVPIFPPMAALLDELDAEFGAHRKFLLPIKEARGTLDRACARLKLPRLTHHTFRHIFTSHALMAKVDVATVAKWRGDKDRGAMLLKNYAHILDAHSRKMAKRVKF